MTAREVVTDADQLPIHPGDGQGIAGRHRRGRGQEPLPALAEAPITAPSRPWLPERMPRPLARLVNR